MTDIKEYICKLINKQQIIRENKKGVILLIDGFEVSGKGTLINKITSYLDPKFYNVYNLTEKSNTNRKPFITKYYEKIPEYGMISIFDTGWTNELVDLKVKKKIDNQTFQKYLRDIEIFEKQLVDNNYIIIKLFLDIDKDTQKLRISKTLSKKHQSWKISKTDVLQNKKYDKYKEQFTNIIKCTNYPYSKWNIIEQNEKDIVFKNAIDIIINSLQIRKQSTKDYNAKKYECINMLDLEKVNLHKKINNKEYKQELKRLQSELFDLQNKVYEAKIPVMIAYEGWDAAGKGGNIKRIRQVLDQRLLNVYPICSPNEEEKNKFYLWRFWKRIPKTGHFAIFDRSWYGRVMVEKIEEYCTQTEWKRAYNEINEFEETLTNNGVILIKFWVDIDKKTQLDRFTARQNTPEKQWKITDEDWRNREKWDSYKIAINEMLQKTNTKNAQWYILESNDKKYARIKALSIINEILRDKLNEQ